MREGLEDARGAAATEDGDVLLSVVGTHPSDPALLLLRAPDGRTFRLPADARLRAALRSAGPVTKPGATVATPLTPRDIQARIRAGESASDVAADAGVPLEQVRRYEGPVLAERAHVGSLARLAVVRGGPGRLTLEEAVRTRLLARGADPNTAAWDAWRRDKGWAVQVAFRAAGRDRSAQWSFSPSSRVLEPLDDEARWLTAPSDDPTGRRLAAVRVYDVDEDGGGLDEAAAKPAGSVGSGLGSGATLAAPARRERDGDAGHASDADEVRTAPAAPAAAPTPTPPSAPVPAPAPETTGTSPLDREPAATPGGVTGALDALTGSGEVGDDTPPVGDDLASRTLDLLDALRDRRGRRVPLDIPPDGAPWDDDEEDDDLLNALLDLPPGSSPAAAELQEEVDRARARLRMVTPPRGLPLGTDEQDGGKATADATAPAAPRASLGLVPAPPPTAPTPVAAPASAPAPRQAGGEQSDKPADSAKGPRETDSTGDDLDRELTRRDDAPLTRRERRQADRSDGPADRPPAEKRPDAPGTGTATGTSGAAETPGKPAAEPEHDGDNPGEQPARRRRSVPSWDEIVFGAPRRE